MHLGNIFTSSLPFPNPVLPPMTKVSLDCRVSFPETGAPLLPQPPIVSLLSRHFPSLHFSFSIRKMGGMISKISSIYQTHSTRLHNQRQPNFRDKGRTPELGQPAGATHGDMLKRKPGKQFTARTPANSRRESEFGSKESLHGKCGISRDRCKGILSKLCFHKLSLSANQIRWAFDGAGSVQFPGLSFLNS